MITLFVTCLEFDAAGQRLEVLRPEVTLAEADLWTKPSKMPELDRQGAGRLFLLSDFSMDIRSSTVRQGEKGKPVQRRLNRDSLDPQQSVLSQRKDPDLYPEVTAIGRAFGRIQTFRDWSFGRYTLLRQPQPADLPNDILLPDARNLGLILNSIENSDEGSRLNECIKRFLPRFRRFSISVQAGTVQILLHEDGLRSPIPATRLSDGTIRFIAILTVLLRPTLAPLICIDEPELGLHPDALSIIAELLVDAARHTQIVVTTHSDALVSALTEHAESVVVCENLAGSTRLRRLDSEKLQFWLKKYRLGEIWRIGELGGNP